MDDIQDPECDWLRENWDAPAPAAGFHERVLAEYVHHFGRAPRWRRWFAIRAPLPVAAAAVFAAFALAWFLSPNPKTPVERHPAKYQAAGGSRYRPVSQPRFIVISQGEHP